MSETLFHLALFFGGAGLCLAVFLVATRRTRRASAEAAKKRERTERALRSILEGTAAPSSEEFFRSLARHLSEAIDVHYAIVGETIDENTVRTLAVWAGDDFAENIEYVLEGTPCENVIEQSTCYVRRNVQALFPRDQLLVEMEAESYLGTPLIDTDGHTLGLLAVLDLRPLDDAELARDLLGVFAGRAAAELARNRAERRRAEAEGQLRQLQKMDAIGQLAGGVAHDFNNLLQVIIGYQELAIAEATPQSSLHDDLERAQAAAERASSLTRQLLAFSRQQVLEPKPLALDEVVADTMRMLRRLIGEDINLEVQSRPGLPTVLADRTQMGQVLMNLVVNSRDAMPSGGTLIVSTNEQVVDDAFRRLHPWASHDLYVRVRVRDTGWGMDEQTLSRAFEPFFTTKKANQGTGLGLATVYGIVQQHGGMVIASSRPQEGTTVDVYLPAACEKAASVERKPPDLPTDARETILLAEDEPSLQALVSRILISAGYTVYTAADGEQALLIYESRSAEIDLVLLDVAMPKLSGPEVRHRMRALDPDVQVLFLSGHPAAVSKTKFALDSNDRLLQKPFSSADLLESVRCCLDSAVTARKETAR